MQPQDTKLAHLPPGRHFAPCSDECSALVKSQVNSRSRLRKDGPLAAPVLHGDWKTASDDAAWKLQAKDVAAVAREM